MARPRGERVEEVIVCGWWAMGAQGGVRLEPSVCAHRDLRSQASGRGGPGGSWNSRRAISRQDSHQEAQSASPAVPSVASSRAFRSACCARWAVHAGTDWYALRMLFAFGQG